MTLNMVLLTAILLLLIEMRLRLQRCWSTPTAALQNVPAGLPSLEQMPDGPIALTDTAVLRLMTHDGVEEAEVSWHKPDRPMKIEYGGFIYHQRAKRADGTWEYVR